jgi:hypothetical protein
MQPSKIKSSNNSNKNFGKTNQVKQLILTLKPNNKLIQIL